MNEITVNNEEFKSLKIIIKYLLDNEKSHYEESSKNDKYNHIYQHTTIVKNILKKCNNKK